MDYLARIAELEKENLGLRKKLESTISQYNMNVSLASELAGKVVNINQIMTAIRASDLIRQDGFYLRGESGLSAKEFVERLKLDSNWDFHFKHSKPSSKSSDSNQKNPFSKETFNLSEQMKLMKSNPELADRLKREAT
ncbi:hypothetical protein FEK30_01130 (plasmid) [Picosynechococcus sp. PCC 11901]|uniref:hypothetical protein n=1 Tax=Picosynechococcus sp. PCC 11901 TaxID=2579791 RepID=UPI0010FC2142|nr:hypothetical protein [Picosynechococcus sp. PCC 11901]QCS48147.1 hypothetical protein FEK30_01130 [Picosynechococcus sp. PCC 11901]